MRGSLGRVRSGLGLSLGSPLVLARAKGGGPMGTKFKFKKVDNLRLLEKPEGPLPRMFCATVVERRPLIKHFEDWEDDFLGWRERNMEACYGREGDPMELLTLEKKASGGKITEEDLKERKRKDKLREELWKEFLQLREKYNVTVADRNHDVKSILRALDKRLFLVVKSASTSMWGFPMSQYNIDRDEHLRATAEQAIYEQVGKKYFRVWMVGNAPTGWNERLEKDGEKSKIFYFNSELVWDDGGKIPEVKNMLDPTLNNAHVAQSTADFAWLTKPELKEYLDEPTWAVANRMLIEY